jgi:MGT family glycosyltransferase
VVGFCAEGLSHVRTLLAPLAALRERGLDAHVFTAPALRPEVDRVGAEFHDLYAGRPVAELDDSIPIPTRNVTFAASFAEAVAAEIEPLRPRLIVYETFCVIAPVVARLLNVPYVNVSPNHDLVPERAIPARRTATDVVISERCEAAVERLRDVHGIEDASPFYYLAARSPHLNLYPEPEEFLPPADRSSFEPIAFFGSLEPSLQRRRRARRARGVPERVLISLGTILWRYMEDEALALLEALADSLAELQGVRAEISLGNRDLAASRRRSLERRNVAVRDYVDLRSRLAEVDALVTHHGLNSTHEAIYAEVPMVSAPFYADQPHLAARCQELGLAVALGEPRTVPAPGALGAALERIGADAEGFEEHLAEARQWELRTIAGRDEVIERMLGIL